MKNKNIVLASLVVIILGGLIAYQYIRKPKENMAGNNKEQVTQEKIVKNQEVATDVSGTDLVAGESEDVSNSIVYFYGAECPHCKDVLTYLDENDIYSKVDFVKKEVWHNKKNGEELRTAALKCGMDPSNIGVPFLFSEGKCYMGGPDVIDFFAKKAGLKK